MADLGLAAAAFFINFDDDEDLILPLLDELLKKHKNPEFPYRNYPRFVLETVAEDDCLAHFRFKKADLPTLANVLRIPEKIVCPNGTTADGTY